MHVIQYNFISLVTALLVTVPSPYSCMKLLLVLLQRHTEYVHLENNAVVFMVTQPQEAQHALYVPTVRSDCYNNSYS